MIKVKGEQVAPADLEAHLLSHPSISDCVVIGIPDQRAGEVPRAYVVLSASGIDGQAAQSLQKDILEYVREHKDRSMWLTGGVEFVSIIPKSPSGKILRRVLKEKAAIETRSKL